MSGTQLRRCLMTLSGRTRFKKLGHIALGGHIGFLSHFNLFYQRLRILIFARARTFAARASATTARATCRARRSQTFAGRICGLVPAASEAEVEQGETGRFIKLGVSFAG